MYSCRSMPPQLRVLTNESVLSRTKFSIVHVVMSSSIHTAVYTRCCAQQIGSGTAVPVYNGLFKNNIYYRAMYFDCSKLLTHT